MHNLKNTKRFFIPIFLFFFSVYGYLPVHAKSNEFEELKIVIQKNLAKEGVRSQIGNGELDLCETYSMPNKLCKSGLKTQVIISTRKLKLARIWRYKT